MGADRENPDSFTTENTQGTEKGAKEERGEIMSRKVP